MIKCKYTKILSECEAGIIERGEIDIAIIMKKDMEEVEKK